MLSGMNQIGRVMVDGQLLCKQEHWSVFLLGVGIHRLLQLVISKYIDYLPMLLNCCTPKSIESANMCKATRSHVVCIKLWSKSLLRHSPFLDTQTVELHIAWSIVTIFYNRHKALEGLTADSSSKVAFADPVSDGPPVLEQVFFWLDSHLYRCAMMAGQPCI